MLSNIKSTTEYLSHLTLVTGSENKHIRQYALDSGALIDDQLSDYAQRKGMSLSDAERWLRPILD